MIGYIYITTNLINNKIYVGQHKKKFFDIKYIGSGHILLKAINKYGINNFKCEIIEWCKSQKELNEKEKYWIKFYKPEYNIAEGGNGGNLGEKINKKISQSVKGLEHPWVIGHIWINKNYEVKRIKLEEFEKYQRLGWSKGKPIRPEINELRKKKISNSMKGIKRSEEFKQKVSKTLMNHPCYKKKKKINLN